MENIRLKIILFIAIFLLRNQAQTQETQDERTFQKFMALLTHETNLRTGPGLEYPIAWVYKHKDLPVRVVSRLGAWCKIQDTEKSEGWVYKNMLSHKMTAITQNGFHPVHHLARDSSKVLAYAYPGVVGRVRTCTRLWCRLQFRHEGKVVEGWLKKDNLWGYYKLSPRLGSNKLIY